MLSIVIPVYNVEQYLPQCLDSILSQTCGDFEVLLVNDGSTDNSGAICEQYAKRDSRFKAFTQVNKGVSAARNFGIEQAQGEYISFIDSDDWIVPNYIETLFAAQSIADITFFGLTFTYPDRKVDYVPEEGVYSTQDEVKSALKYLKVNEQNVEFLGYTWSKMFRKSIVDKFSIRFIEGLKVREDEVFTLKYCQHVSSLQILPYSLYNYRILDGSLTRSRKKPEELIRLSDALFDLSLIYRNSEIGDVINSDIVTYLYSATMSMSSFAERKKTIEKMIRTKRTLNENLIFKSGKLRLIFAFDFYIYNFVSAHILSYL